MSEFCSDPLLHYLTESDRQLRRHQLFDGRAAAKIDPEGPIFAIEKGELIMPRGVI